MGCFVSKSKIEIIGPEVPVKESFIESSESDPLTTNAGVKATTSEN
jgi:hypothetical protein